MASCASSCWVLAAGPTGASVQDFTLADGERPLRMPTAVAVDADGSVFVLDGVHDRIVTFQPDGRFTGVIAPTGDGALQQPVGLRIGPDGKLWIADTGHGRIVVCALNGTVERTLQPPPARADRAADPTDLAFTSGAVWVCDNDNHRLLRYDTQAETWRKVGERGESLGQWNYPFQMAVNRAGDVVASDVLNGRVQSVGGDGAPKRSLGSYGVEAGQFYRPSGVAVDSEDRIWVADSVLGVVQVLRGDGTYLGALQDDAGKPLRFEAPLGLAFDSAGALYVVESRANRVRKVAITPAAQPWAPVIQPPRRTASGRQARACTVCHLDWMPPFSEGRDSSMVARPASRPDEPVPSRVEICFSCHDGTVADSRKRVWAEHGHATGVAPPAGMEVPKLLPLIDGKLACRTCHSAHGDEAGQADISRAVMLRVPNKASELCASCHADKTGGPRFGTHPTGGMPWDVPDKLRAAGAKVGPNPRELTCQVCHSPHGAQFDHLLVMEATSNQLCLTCHDQLRPGMFRADGHTEHPLMAKLDPVQTAAVQELGTRIGSQGELVCLSCHKLHHGKGGRFLLADELAAGQMCLRCHEERRDMLGSPHDLRTNFPAERNRLGMTVADGGPCSACHLFHRYARVMTPGDGDASGQCLTCHREGSCAQNKSLGNFNHPSPRCTECHNPHQTRFGSFLRESTANLCSSCHADKTQLLGGPHDSTSQTPAWCAVSDRAGDSCLACHRPHGDEQHGNFRVEPIVTESGRDGVCIACHAATAAEGEKALLHPRASNPSVEGSGLPLAGAADGPRRMGCATCHDPHAGPASGSGGAKALLRSTASDDGARLCVRCHTEMRQIAVTAHGPDSLREHGFDSAACEPCHQIHGNTQNTAERLLWPSTLRQADGKAGDAYCVGCHRDGGSAHPPTIATHPSVPMFDVALGQESGLPLFDESGERDAHGRIGCQTCHLPHGRPMPDLPSDAQRTPELRAQRIQLRPFDAPNVCTTCHSTDALRRFIYFHDPQRRSGGVATR